MENKDRFPDKKLDKILYDYFEGQVEGVSSHYTFTETSMVVHNEYFSFHGNALLNVACALILALISLLGLMYDVGASPLGETVTDFIHATDFDTKIPGLLKHIYELDVFK